MAKVGRPKATAKERKGWRYPRLSVPLTAEEEQAINAAAERAGQKPATWARETLLAAAR